MRVYIVETPAVCNEFIKSYDAGDSIAVCDNYRLQKALISAGLPFRTRMDYLLPDDVDEVLRACSRYQQKWYRYHDLTLFDGIHFGSFFNASYNDLFALVLFLELAAKVFENDRPGEIMTAEGRIPVLSDLAGEMGIKCSLLSPSRTVMQRLGERTRTNPYIRFLIASRGLKHTIMQVMEYLLPVPLRLLSRGSGRRSVAAGSILVAVSGRNPLRIMEGVVRRLRERGRDVTFFVVNDDSGGVLMRMKENGFNDYLMPGDFISPGLILGFMRISREMKARWRRAVSDPGFIGSMRHRGVALMPYANMTRYKWIATRLVPFWVVVNRQVKGIIGHGNISMVMVSESRTAIGQIASSAAQERELPSVDIQHGAFYGPWRVDSMPSSRLCVWGDWFRHEAEEYGVSESRTVITGSPTHDAYYGWSPDATALRRSLGMPAGYRKTIMWAPSAEGIFYRSGEDVNERLLSAFLDIMREMPDVLLVVKLHPSEMPAHMVTMVEDAPANILMMDRNRDIGEGIHLCDVFVSWNSTVTVDAILLDKPVIAANLISVNEWPPYIREGVAVPARTPEGLREAIEDIISDRGGINGRLKEARARFIAKYLLPVDGRACERIADQVEELAPPGRGGVQGP